MVRIIVDLVSVIPALLRMVALAAVLLGALSLLAGGALARRASRRRAISGRRKALPGAG